jgi:hypothetical protein
MRRLWAVEISGSDIKRLKKTDGYLYNGEGRVATKNVIRLHAWSLRGGVELKRRLRVHASETKAAASGRYTVRVKE